MATSIRIATTSARLKEAMHQVSKTPADVARETGLNKSTLSRYLSGAVEPKQNAVAKLASSLNVSEMWLWGYDVPMVKETKKSAPIEESGMSEAKMKLFALADSCTEEEAERLLKVMELILEKQ
jgi:transcriptional regulator with XRE-family HTH domain